MSERVLNVGVVGCGMMAAGTHIPLIAANAGLKLRWLCDLDVPRAKGLADRHGAAVSEGLTHVRPDADGFVEVPRGVRPFHPAHLQDVFA